MMESSDEQSFVAHCVLRMATQKRICLRYQVGRHSQESPGLGTMKGEDLAERRS